MTRFSSPILDVIHSASARVGDIGADPWGETAVHTSLRWYYVRMIKRTTIEIDEELLARAKRALHQPTARATVEEALRRAAAQAEDAQEARAARLREHLASLGTRVDLDVLASDEMWR